MTTILPGKTLADAEHALADAAPGVAGDAQRPRCHFLPPARWMNDPNGTIFHDGWYHLFYQFHPYGDDWGSMHWGHARSRDLIGWEYLPIALAPRADLGEEHCFSGCIAIGDDGAPRLLYTSVAPGGDKGRPTEQWVARGDRALLAWERGPAPAVGRGRADEPDFDHGARDPYVFRADGRTWMILGARLGEESVIPIYEAADGTLERWTYRGIMHREPASALPYPECPNLFPVGDRFLLAVSPCSRVRWTLGSFHDGAFTAETTGVLDLHDHWYASNTLVDDQGRVVLLGWVKGFAKGRGWSGCLAFPRLVEPDGACGIRQRPHPALEALRAGEPIAWSGRTEGETTIAEDAGDAIELHARLHPIGDCATLMLGSTCGAGIEIRWDGACLHVAGGSYAVASLDGWLDLRLFLDRSVVEIFADDGRSVLTRVVAEARNVGRYALRGAEGDCRMWRLASCVREVAP